MKQRTLAILGGAAALSVVSALLVTPGNPPPPAGAGKLAFEGLAPRLRDATRIEITKHDGRLVLERRGDAWVVADDRGGYPVRPERVRELLVGLTEVRLLEPRTADPAMHERLGVDDPSKPGSTGLLVRVRDSKEAAVAELVVGRRRVRTGGNLPESAYVRRPAEAQSWLAEGRIPADSDPQLWLDRDVVNLPAARVRSVSVKRPDEAAELVLARGEAAGGAEGAKLAVSAPSGFQATDESALEEVARALESVTFLDVKAEAGAPSNPMGETRFSLADGLSVVAAAARGEGDAVWLRLRAEGTGAAEAEAERLNARWRGWAYQVAAWKEKALLPRLTDLGGRASMSQAAVPRAAAGTTQPAPEAKPARAPAASNEDRPIRTSSLAAPSAPAAAAPQGTTPAEPGSTAPSTPAPSRTAVAPATEAAPGNAAVLAAPSGQSTAAPALSQPSAAPAAPAASAPAAGPVPITAPSRTDTPPATPSNSHTPPAPVAAPSAAEPATTAHASAPSAGARTPPAAAPEASAVASSPRAEPAKALPSESAGSAQAPGVAGAAPPDAPAPAASAAAASVPDRALPTAAGGAASGGARHDAAPPGGLPPPAQPVAPPVAAGVDHRYFKDCPTCPGMVQIPGGGFTMGQGAKDPAASPAHRVTIRPFALGQYPVTVAEWKACHAAGDCPAAPSTAVAEDTTPAHNISWEDAQRYVGWLSRTTGRAYRLPTEAEWEYAARAGTATRYWWGDQVGVASANCADCGGAQDPRGPLPVDRFQPNGFGLHGMLGGVAQWTQDCWSPNYQGAPADGSAREARACSKRVLRGGSFRSGREEITPTARSNYDAPVRYLSNGFRVARNPD